MLAHSATLAFGALGLVFGGHALLGAAWQKGVRPFLPGVFVKSALLAACAGVANAWGWAFS